MVVRLEPEIERIIAPWRGKKHLLRFVEDGEKYTSFYSRLAKGMNALSARIGEDATYYAARHSWATLARNDCGVDKYTVHEALGHSDTATKMDDIYIKKDYSIYWAANRKVMDLFSWD